MNRDVISVLNRNHPSPLWGSLSDALAHLEEMMELDGWDGRDTRSAVNEVVRLIEGSVQATEYTLATGPRIRAVNNPKGGI